LFYSKLLYYDIFTAALLKYSLTIIEALKQNNSSIMKALVTGATGFIGSHLAEALLSRGYEVRCLVRSGSNRRWLETLCVEFVEGDCLDEKSLEEAVKGCNYVFHVAGITKACRENDFFCVNVDGTRNLINTVIKYNNKIERFVFISSLAAVGPSLDGRPVNEETEPHPVSVYGKSKLEAERVVLGVTDQIPITIIRPPAVYGPRDRDFYFFFKLIKRGIFPYWGKARYSLVYVDDLINGIIMSAESSEAVGQTYFIADGEVYSNEEIAYEISRILNKNITKVHLPKSIMPFLASIGERFSRGPSIFNKDKVRELKYQHWICDSSKAERELGYKPKVKLSEGLKWTANWYKINRWL
jgi:nucleoside-diphosphate-sugar epimerase